MRFMGVSLLDFDGREQEIGNREQEIGNREQEIGNRE